MNFTIYGLKEKGNDEIKYIGLTTSKLSIRFSKHLSDKKVDHKTNWIKKIGKDNVEIVVIEDEISDIDTLHEKEIFYINKYKKEGHNLTNITNGGEGWYNMVFSDEHKKNISLNHADVSGENNPMFGKEHTINVKNKIRDFRLNYKISDETKEKMKCSKLGEKNTNVKLTSDDVLKIRQYVNEYTQKELASMFNVKPGAISKIINHTTWKHLK